MGKSRFEHIEIGQNKIDININEDEPKGKGTAAYGSKMELWQKKCPSCGKVIARAGNCFYCGLNSNEFVPKYKKIKVEDNDLEISREWHSVNLTINGKTYNSSDADLPPDVQNLMLRIQNEGFSRRLLEEWARTRAIINNADFRHLSSSESEEAIKSAKDPDFRRELNEALEIDNIKHFRSKMIIRILQIIIWVLSIAALFLFVFYRTFVRYFLG